jgi:hypothetical protein
VRKVLDSIKKMAETEVKCDKDEEVRVCEGGRVGGWGDGGGGGGGQQRHAMWAGRQCVVCALL